MFKRISSTEERLLGERLRREAMESRPAFSESLHDRIVCAVRQRRAAGNSPSVRVGENGTVPFPARRPRGLPAALAAACLLCAAAIGWQMLQNASQPAPVHLLPPTPEASIADLPSINDLADRTVRKLDGLAVSAAWEPQATHLKNDARTAAGMFLDRLPIDVKLADNR
jgi:hypothetical protein